METSKDGYSVATRIATVVPRHRRRPRGPIKKIGFGLEETGLGGLSGAEWPEMDPTVALTRMAQMFAAAEASRIMGPMLDTLVRDMVDLATDFLYSRTPVISMRDYTGVWDNLPSEYTTNAVAAITNFLPENLRLPARLSQSELDEIQDFEKTHKKSFRLLLNDIVIEETSTLPPSVDPTSQDLWYHKGEEELKTFDTVLKLAQIRHETWKALSEIMTDDGKKAFSYVAISLIHEDHELQHNGNRTVHLHYDESGVRKYNEVDNVGDISRHQAHTLNAVRLIVAVTDTRATIIPDCDLKWGENFYGEFASEMQIIRRTEDGVERDNYKVRAPEEGRQCPNKQEMINIARNAPRLDAGDAVGGLTEIVPHSSPVRDKGDVWMVVTLMGSRDSSFTTEKVMGILKDSDFFKNR